MLKQKRLRKRANTRLSLFCLLLNKLFLFFSPAELHQTQPVAAQPLYPRAERGDGKELVVDVESGGREERQVPETQGGLHGQQQQVYEEQRKSRKEKGKEIHRTLSFQRLITGQ